MMHNVNGFQPKALTSQHAGQSNRIYRIQTERDERRSTGGMVPFDLGKSCHYSLNLVFELFINRNIKQLFLISIFIGCLCTRSFRPSFNRQIMVAFYKRSSRSLQVVKDAGDIFAPKRLSVCAININLPVLPVKYRLNNKDVPCCAKINQNDQ